MNASFFLHLIIRSFSHQLLWGNEKYCMAFLIEKNLLFNKEGR
jgi:hypothetical protein